MYSTVALKTFVILLALMKANSAFNIPSQDEITKAIGTAVLRNAGTQLVGNFMRKFTGNSGTSNSGTGGQIGGDPLSPGTQNGAGNFGASSPGAGGGGLMNAVMQGVTAGMRGYSSGSAGGVPGNGGFLNNVLQAAGGNYGQSSPAPSGGGLISNVLRAVGGNYGQSSAAPSGGGLLDTVLRGPNTSPTLPSSGSAAGTSGGNGFFNQLKQTVGSGLGTSGLNYGGDGLLGRFMKKAVAGAFGSPSGRRGRKCEWWLQ
ncbi:uncharacterized transmembrane protein DDB_G0289901-like isoform X2 [Dermacentor silvarum]|uniref:uncharacterized transmembrane protein DDB_G0289901-like isoform X2 n=1 Tax=Dermacentor silvarum TaxID=543639 RepID=UPI00210138EA|nr:uncharacterized transmembrane protein DDB_G0289901-like isoform X2 [Dermacentor silvarum]